MEGDHRALNCDRISLNTATCKRLSLGECVAAARAGGLGAIGPWRDRVRQIGAEAAARLFADAGLRVSSLCRGGFLTARGDGAIAAALADNRAAVDEAALIGARELVMVVGGLPAASAAMGLADQGAAADKALGAARQRVADRIGDLTSYARQRGVRLALEPMHPLFTADRGVITTLGQALDLAADFTAEEVGVVVDTYHVWWDPQVEASIARAGREGRLCSYQVSDWVLPLAPDTLNSRGMMGDGYIDFPMLTKSVHDAGYAGDVEVEIFNERLWGLGGSEVVRKLVSRCQRLILPHL
jgi:sugar phosphate isomerase/epimerase